MADQPAVIQYEDVARLDLRVATVVQAEAHPNADKLVVMKVDVGGAERQIVAGIRSQYEPAQLIGRQIVIVANLAPRTLRGLESNGMLLAAVTDDRSQIAFVTPEKAIQSGTRVS